MDTIQETLSLPAVISLELCPNDGKVFPCERCDLKFKSEEDLKTHSFPNKNSYSCPICFKGFSTNQGMRQHFGKKHSRTRHHKCPWCHKRFKTIYAVRTHKQLVHLHRSRQTCQKCGKSVFNKFSLSRHERVCSRALSSYND